MQIKLSLPNDYDCADDEAAMLKDADDREPYEIIRDAAHDAGLEWVRDTDFGAIWSGTSAQIDACLAALPSWARPYASLMDY